MKALTLAVLTLCVLGTACATTANYEARVHSWQGQKADLLVRAWGEPDATEKLSSGNKMYVYSRLKHPPMAYVETGRAIASVEQAAPAQPIYQKCATYFEVSPENRIVSTTYRGEQCKWKD